MGQLGAILNSFSHVPEEALDPRAGLQSRTTRMKACDASPDLDP